MKETEKVPFDSMPQLIRGSFLTKEQVEKIKEPFKNIVSVVRCKDCKHLIDHYGFMDDGYCKKMREDYNAKLKPKKDWFCADGERKD